MSDALLAGYQGLVVDLDGVVYRGPDAVDHAADALNAAVDQGLPVMYATNNAGRPAATVAEHLTELGVRTDAEHVVTSAQAGAALLADQLEPGTTVLAVGGPGVAIALREVGLDPVTPGERIEDPEVAGRVRAVLQGYGTELTWSDLKEAAYAVSAGATWMATNVDLTIPTERGIAPGNGSAVAAVRNVIGRDPQVAGKPYPPLYERCAERAERDVARMLAVGDRLDTDIEGANASGMDSLLVLTGVDGPLALASAPDRRRATYVALDLRSLHEPYAAAQLRDGAEAPAASCGDAVATVDGHGDDATLTVSGGDPIEQVRAAVTAVWAARDAGRVGIPLPAGVAEPLEALDPR
ncbi:HAD-IIA family hydrolase [Arsenicicoccus sp. oral taxon 190]|uniref:HAD-IIA family hydrolase n=1 Tax=Arsenicicoccus sp. oral taxon 190 TaxID=1658671 RepID=UPI00067A0A91|nr:HAD-IIA family hydrolase [Arsenicicoccus sp. oral taxon 190]AKT51678.1 hypothetical protein ADJ73_10980 [Arsenicicoccus sp. oral taxon 190]